MRGVPWVESAQIRRGATGVERLQQDEPGAQQDEPEMRALAHEEDVLVDRHPVAPEHTAPEDRMAMGIA